MMPRFDGRRAAKGKRAPIQWRSFQIYRRGGEHLYAQEINQRKTETLFPAIPCFASRWTQPASIPQIGEFGYTGIIWSQL
jgi:hypothetical protein